MLKDTFDSFSDNIKQRLSNPFLGTFTLVWIVHNWKIVYAFFYFDDGTKLQAKIDYFNIYWKNHNFVLNLGVSALITLLILIVTYLFLAISRLLSNYFENVIIPFIYKISKGTIVTGEVYKTALNNIERLETRIEEERKAKVQAQEEIERLERKLYSQNTDETNDMSESEIENLISLIESRFKDDDVKEVLTNIGKHRSISRSNEIVDFLVNRGFVEFESNSSSSGFDFYKLTSSGNEFRRHFFTKNNK